jgi:sialate O-acetylesterase
MKHMISKTLQLNSMAWVFILLVFSATQSYAQESMSLASLFQDDMVLQQKSDVAIWGWAVPGENIKVIGSWQKESMTVRLTKI